MRSFILLERPEDRRRNKLVILGFLVFIIVISYIIYGSVSYGLSKLEIYSYSDLSIYDSDKDVHLRTIDMVCGTDNQFKAYVAANDKDREKGLSIFPKIKSDESMIFVFDSLKKYSFWMKGMKFPIDMVWLDQDKKVVDIKNNIAVNSYPELFTPSDDSLYVLEFNAGTTYNSNIKIGDVCDFDSSGLK